MISAEKWFSTSGYPTLGHLILRLGIQPDDPIEDVALRVEEEAFDNYGKEVDATDLAENLINDYEEHIEEAEAAGCDSELATNYFGRDTNLNQNAKLSFAEKQYAINGLLG